VKFYTNVSQQKNQLCVRYIEDGVRKMKTVKYAPTLYIPTDEVGTGWRDLHNTPLEQVQFRSMWDAKNYIENNEGEVYGNASFVYPYIGEEFTDTPADFSDVRVFSLDIETESEDGFSSPQDATERINLITVKDKKTQKRWTFGLHPFEGTPEHLEHPERWVYYHCETEKNLLAKFLTFWQKKAPDVITGWNIKFYDIPYLVNRIVRVLGEESVSQLSPWDQVYSKPVEVFGRIETPYVLGGIATLDYLDLYKKFTYTGQESYKLDHIAYVELGRQKLENPYGSFKEFYTKDWKRFVEYNVIDVDLVEAIDQKKKLISLIMTMAYDAKSNYEDVFSAVRTWDCIIYNHLIEQGIVPPIVNPHTRQDTKIVGGYVKIPHPGMYKWVCSFDAASLYPSIILQYNMSPETLLPDMMQCTVDDMVNRAIRVPPDRALAANGYGFRTDTRGQFAQLVDRIFRERVAYKKKMLLAEQQYQEAPSPELANQIDEYNNRQLARKIQLNSLYGAQANKYFRFYDVRIAEGITMSGQAIVRTMINTINTFMNDFCQTQGVDYAFYSDTDSVYVTFDRVVTHNLFEKREGETDVDALSRFCEEVMGPVFDGAAESYREYTNAYQNAMFFKREIIADRGVWADAKKRYALNVYDAENVRYTTPKLKSVGFETNRSTTPKFVRDALKKGISICLNHDQSTLQTFIAEFREEYMRQPVDVISAPTTVNGVHKYADPTSIYGKGTPIHVRAALLYNNWVAKTCDGVYPYIREGDKMKYVMLSAPNPWGENVIGAPDAFPKMMQIEKYVDYDTMFQKTFLSPLNKILSVLHWTSEEMPTLNDLFV